MTHVQSFKISAVIPAYNAGKYLVRSIDSVLGQTRPADEIIVVDDGSTDNTAEVIKSYGDRVRYIRQPNAGVSAARNTGIQAAIGDWIAFLDADDEWLPGRLERQLALLEHNPGLVWVTGNYLTCLFQGRRIPYLLEEQAERLLGHSVTVPDYLDGCARDLGGHTDTMLIRRSVLLEAGLFSTDLIKAEDMDLWWRIAYRYPEVGYVSTPLAVYHLGSVDSLTRTQMKGVFFADLIRKHLKISREYHCDSRFDQLAARLLRGWMRSMLFTAQGGDIRYLIGEFGTMFPYWYRGLMRALTVFPKMTAAVCYLLSRVNKIFHLKRRQVQGPQWPQ